MTLHIFNPEHDLALAANLSNFTPPRAGRQLRRDLGFLPALWAREGDAVWVDDAEEAERLWQELSRQFSPTGGESFSNGWRRFLQRLEKNAPTAGVNRVEPWGWDRALCAQLRRAGVSDGVLPTDEQLERIRQLSHRRTAARLLPLLRMEGTVGEAFECRSIGEVDALLGRYGQLMLKMPWSSSGRGVRPLTQDAPHREAMNRWMANTLAAQGSLMAEPYYQKIGDLAMEFTALPDGRIRYEGLSVFHTRGGAYTGNVVATEAIKEKMVSSSIPTGLLRDVQEKIADTADLRGYCGPFGVDMMMVLVEGRRMLHPCVELNLRRTMGHVALALHRRLNPEGDDRRQWLMNIGFDGAHYRLSCQQATAAAAATLSESTP